MGKSQVTINGQTFSFSGVHTPKTIDGLSTMSTPSSNSRSASPSSLLEDTPQQPISAASYSRSLRAQPSRLLHRSSVKKPIIARPSSHQISQSPRVGGQTPYDRAVRATHTQPSPAIGRFKAPALGLQLSDIAVVEPPPKSSSSIKPIAPPTKKETNIFEAHVNKVFSDSSNNNKSDSKLSFKKLLMSASATVAIIALVISSYWLIPGVSVKIAGLRAGFGPTMPSTPRDFSLVEPASYSQGKVSLSYSATSSDRGNFVLHQQPSKLDSASLASGYLAANGIEYQTHTKLGRTIYIYDGNQATWVSGGIWYVLEGQTDLSVNEILNIAASL